MPNGIRLDVGTHTYWLGDRRVPGFSEICKETGITKENPFYTEQGRAEGIALHEWLGFLVRGKVPKEAPHPSIADRVEGIKAFIRDTGFGIVGGEVPQYDLVNDFACTPDLWGYIKGVSWIIDCKRGQKLAVHALQTAAQSIALSANGFRAQKRGALYLSGTRYKITQHEDRMDVTRWRQITAGYHAGKQYSGK